LLRGGNVLVGGVADETYPRGSSRRAVFFIEVVFLVALGVFVVAYRAHWIEPRKAFFGPVPFLVPWFGAVGAALLSLTGVFDHRGRDWKPAYCYWHWARPLVGAIVASVSILIFQSGILAVGGQLPTQTTGTSAATNTKNLLYFVIAFVVGYREDIFRQLVKRFADVILTPPADGAAGPVIESADPPQATAGQETEVIIGGSGFTGTTSVKLADAEIPFTVASDTQLTATIPADAVTGATTLAVTSAGRTKSTPYRLT
jgi:IPT/TIG domain